MMESEKRSFKDKLSKIGKEILELKNKEELDNNVILHVNTSLCNFSNFSCGHSIHKFAMLQFML